MLALGKNSYSTIRFCIFLEKAFNKDLEKIICVCKSVCFNVWLFLILSLNFLFTFVETKKFQILNQCVDECFVLVIYYMS